MGMKMWGGIEIYHGTVAPHSLTCTCIACTCKFMLLGNKIMPQSRCTYN